MILALTHHRGDRGQPEVQIVFICLSAEMVLFLLENALLYNGRGSLMRIFTKVVHQEINCVRSQEEWVGDIVN